MFDRSRIAYAIQDASHAIGLSSLLARRHGGVVILMFHDVGVADYPAEVLEGQLRYLRDRYRIIGIADGLSVIDSATRSERPPLVLTFDDGLRNHAEVAYPILKRLEVPAVFYACPGLIETGAWAWNFETAARLHALDPAARQRYATEAGTTLTEPEPLAEWMKWLAAARRRTLVEQLRAATPGFTPSAAQRRRYDPMSWSELLALDPALVTIGSHTVTHPILSRLDPAEAVTEVRESRRLLERHLQRPVEHFCYPNGDTSPAVSAAVAETYRSAVGTVRGIARAGDDRFHLPRLPVPRRLAGLSWRLHRAT